MQYVINGQIINRICKLHGVEYGNVKELPKGTQFDRNTICDVCTALGLGTIIQSTISIKKHEGLSGKGVAKIEKKNEK